MNIKVIYSKKHFDHDPKFEICDGKYEPYAEKAERMSSIVKNLQENNIGKFYLPSTFPMKHIYNVHQKEYVSFLQKRSIALSKGKTLYPSSFIMDTYTPITSGTFQAAKASVDVALTGAGLILKGEKIAYSLCRPPGHHADRKSSGGYCYFNNAAIAAEYLSEFGRVAILDIDFHHGNGTQQIFYERSDVLYVSIHADPRLKFPYSSGFTYEMGEKKGLGYNKNYPLSLGTTNTQYLRVLKKGLADIKSFKPDFFILSLGFDTYEHDPIGGFRLTTPFYNRMGKEISELSIPTLIIQEGGYNIANLGKMAVSFLEGITSFAKVG